ncbi:hypothetical protein UB34_01370 [Photobacterium leiognathi]|uniref:glycosyltransferase n=1 Tax=Photobacterium leiognathi TaxID=553611 RepID=UPI0005D41E0E|nr:glycosyltransferase [Photobacterium leiognathi]KJF99714.1 hypothetical protein UB34_01370 [Photobacterium leiognathi]
MYYPLLKKLNIEKRIFKLKKFLQWLKTEEKEKSFDVIFSEHGETNDIISYINDPRLIYCIHNSDEHTYNNKNLYNRWKYKNKITKKISGKHVVCVSDGIKDFLIETSKNSYKSISRIYNPFSFEEIKKLSLQDTAYDLPENFIVFVGRLEKQKNLNLLLESLVKMKSKINLVIIGEGSLEHDIRNKAKILGLEDQVFIYPFCLNPYSIMRQAKMLILTSIHEGFGNVLVESLICGTPAISVNCPSGPSEILSGDLLKYLVDSFEPDVIAKKIDEISTDVDNEIPSSSYDKFSAENIAQEYIDFIYKVKKEGL